uniref:Uncharacterized protein n=1 Tax=candidate division WOR-3 bacterium TaxID=2052148 RepID=A0A7C4TGV6_UNCW3
MGRQCYWFTSDKNCPFNWWCKFIHDLGIVDKNPANVNRHPFIVVDDGGVVHCAWARGTGETNQDPHPWIGYNRSYDRGVTFLSSDIIINDDFTEVYRGNLSPIMQKIVIF